MDNYSYREKLNFSKEDVLSLLWGDGPLDYEIIENRVIQIMVHSSIYRIILRRKSDNKFFADTYDRGHENQEDIFFENDGPHFVEVFPKQITTTIYE